MNLIKQAQLYWHTLSHLKPVQVSGQLQRRFLPKKGRGASIQQLKIPYEGCQWSEELSTKLWPYPSAVQHDAKALKKGKFTFIHQTHNLDWPIQWEQEGLPKLWSYNLHYFEWLWALSFEEAVPFVKQWIAFANTHPSSIAWDAYPISLRLQNWVGFFWHKHRDKLEDHEDFLQELWTSFAQQAESLTQQLETHLLGNHLLENAVTLSLIGSAFKGKYANQWLKLGKKWLKAELDEQILPDGMHFELSPMYHQRVLYLVQLLAQFGDREITRKANQLLPQMRKALSKLCHPDGEIALFNDSAMDIYPPPSQLLGEHFQTDRGAWSLEHAGYYGFRSEDRSYIVCDAGRIGPDYIPGHAHGDIFSFELTLQGHRVLVDSGIYDYQPGKMRKYCRSTRAHNTIEINAQDQCEFWDVFRVARRGYPHQVRFQPSQQGFVLEGWHNGYQSLGDAKHHRTFQWKAQRELLVKDIITSSQQLQVRSRLHLHPSCKLVEHSEQEVTFAYPEGHFTITFYGPGTLLVDASYYCPAFGKKYDNTELIFEATGNNLDLSFQIRG